MKRTRERGRKGLKMLINEHFSKRKKKGLTKRKMAGNMLTRSPEKEGYGNGLETQTDGAAEDTKRDGGPALGVIPNAGRYEHKADMRGLPGIHQHSLSGDKS